MDAKRRRPAGDKDLNMQKQKIAAAIIVCSDRAHNDIYKDTSGPMTHDWLNSNGFAASAPHVIQDDAQQIEQSLHAIIASDMPLVVISGGTGLGPRDITPQTLDRICDYPVPGFGELLRRESLKYSLNAYLSRCGAWVKARTLIVALHGNPKAVREQLEILGDLLPHALQSIAGKCQDRRAVQNQ